MKHEGTICLGPANAGADNVEWFGGCRVRIGGTVSIDMDAGLRICRRGQKEWKNEKKYAKKLFEIESHDRVLPEESFG